MSAGPLNRILMVEDEADIRTVAQLALEAVGGFDVLTCSSAREALEKAPRCAPDLILMDVMMPNMDGPAALCELRARADTRHLPVIFMTAKVQPQEVARYKDMGAMGVIAKPFDPMALSAKIRSIWEASG